MFAVEGLVCGTCLVEVLERLHELDGVVEVAMSLEVGGASPVRVLSEEMIPSSALAAAVTAAGFTVCHAFADAPHSTGSTRGLGRAAAMLAGAAGEWS
jgi:copper chaperone CopZ